ncbi:hypothetical protein ES705_32916 [subsurface metagenome]
MVERFGLNLKGEIKGQSFIFHSQEKEIKIFKYEKSELKHLNSQQRINLLFLYEYLVLK